MSFPRYPEYKDSGVEWLGEVPAHWGICRLSSLAEIISGYPFDASLFGFDGVPVIRMSDFANGLVNSDDAKRVDAEKVPGDSLARNNDILLGLSGSISNFAVVREHNLPVAINQRVAIVRAKENCREIAYWLLQSKEFLQQIESQLPATTIQNVSMGQIRNCRFPFPSNNEIERISDFLSRETTKIDTLIAEQEQLITLLKEKRQAVISHAVTKGLDPNVKMKDSGIEWLGEVPGHWDVLPLKRNLQFLTSGSRGWAEHYSDEGSLFIRIGNLTRDGIGLDLSDIQRVTVPDGSEGERTRLRYGDVLFSITAYLGSVAVVPKDLEPAYISQHVALARLNQEKAKPEWVAYVTLSDVGKIYLESQGYGGTKIQLGLDDVANIIIPLPPADEQEEIITVLENQLARFAELTIEAEAVIDILKERRSALISAAVTGKIDVRKFA